MIKTVQMIQVGDFDTLVEKTYGKVYNFQQQDGCKPRGIKYFSVPIDHPFDYENSTIPEEINGEVMGVSFEAWLERDLTEWNGKPDPGYYIRMFWERNFYPSFDMVVQDLYEKGLIPAGEYVINIDW